MKHSNRQPVAILKASVFALLAACGGQAPEGDDARSDEGNIDSESYATESGYVGCYTDGSPRALPHKLGGAFTAEGCRVAAKVRGYDYAGLQYYGECFAGDSVGYEQVSEDECDTPCSRDSIGSSSPGNCGGAWRNSIWESAVLDCDAWATAMNDASASNKTDLTCTLAQMYLKRDDCRDHRYRRMIQRFNDYCIGAAVQPPW